MSAYVCMLLQTQAPLVMASKAVATRLQLDLPAACCTGPVSRGKVEPAFCQYCPCSIPYCFPSTGQDHQTFFGLCPSSGLESSWVALGPQRSPQGKLLDSDRAVSDDSRWPNELMTSRLSLRDSETGRRGPRQHLGALGHADGLRWFKDNMAWLR